MTVGEQIFGGPRTRAEKVRARRARQLRQYEPLAGNPVRRSKRRRRPRKRLSLALPVELGAEVSIPILPGLRAGPRFVSFVLLVMVSAALNAGLRSPASVVREAEVVGAEMLTAEQVRSIARADRMPAFLVDPRAAETAFEDVAEVAEVKVTVIWPNQVRITLTEREPIVAWHDGGRKWWLSADGVAFLSHGNREDLLTIESSEPVLKIDDDPTQEVIPAEYLTAAAVLKAQLPEAAALVFHPVHGFGFRDERGWTAYFGLEGDMVMKVHLYRAVVDKLVEGGVPATMISVEDPGAPYYRQ